MSIPRFFGWAWVVVGAVFHLGATAAMADIPPRPLPSTNSLCGWLGGLLGGLFMATGAVMAGFMLLRRRARRASPAMGATTRDDAARSKALNRP